MQTPTMTCRKTGYAGIGLLLFTAGLSTQLIAAEHHYSGSGHQFERHTGSMSSGYRHERYRTYDERDEHERKHHKHDHRFVDYGHHRHAPEHYPLRFVVPPVQHYHPLRIAPEPRTSSGIRVWIQLPWLLLE